MSALLSSAVGCQSTDVTQVVNSRLCVLVLCVLAVSHVIIVSVYFREPIQCFCPNHFTDQQCNVVKTHCGVTPDSSYVIYDEDLIPTFHDSPQPTSVPLYYKYVSLILLLQAFLFYLPSLIWKELVRKVGLVPEQFAMIACNAHQCQNAEEKEFCILNLARHLEIFCLRQLRKRHLSFFTTYFHGNKLSLAQFLSKILYAANVIGQFYLLDTFLHMPFHRMGWDLIGQFAFVIGKNGNSQGNTTEEIPDLLKYSSAFEMNVFCDVQLRILGNIQNYSIQCFYYVNALNEFLFKLVWFLLLSAAVVTMTSLAWQLFTLLAFPCRRMGIRERLQDIGAMERNDPRDNEIVKKINRFEKLFLQRDGLLLLNFVERAAGDVIADEILGVLWKLYDSRYSEHERIFKPVQWNEESIGEVETIQEPCQPTRRRYPDRMESAEMAIPMSLQDQAAGDDMEEAPPAYQEVDEKKKE